jgi:hypothetical protein
VTALRAGQFTVQFRSRFPLVIAVLLALVGDIMAGYLALI